MVGIIEYVVYRVLIPHGVPALSPEADCHVLGVLATPLYLAFTIPFIGITASGVRKANAGRLEAAYLRRPPVPIMRLRPRVYRPSGRPTHLPLVPRRVGRPEPHVAPRGTAHVLIGHASRRSSRSATASTLSINSSNLSYTFKHRPCSAARSTSFFPSTAAAQTRQNP